MGTPPQPRDGANAPQIPADTYASGGEFTNDYELREYGDEPRVSIRTETDIEYIARDDE